MRAPLDCLEMKRVLRERTFRLPIGSCMTSDLGVRNLFLSHDIVLIGGKKTKGNECHVS